MINTLILIGAVGLILQAAIGLSFYVSCLKEKESRASLFALLQFIGMSAVLAAYLLLAWTGFFHTRAGGAILAAGYILFAAAVFLFLRKAGANPRALAGTRGFIAGDVKRYDEREIVFARNRSLRPGSEQYEIFYREHPEFKEFDDLRRAKGGPMGPSGAIDSPNEDPNVAMMLASLNVPHYLSDPEKVTPLPHISLSGKLAKKRIELTPEDATIRVKGYARRLGAALVGITEINNNWIYSRRGEIFHENWEDWGKEIKLDNKYAVVFAEEMSHEMIGPAPHTPTAVESMHNYSKGAYIASQLAAFIANLGYQTTANHLRHYDVLMVPLAVDAGLGELGRMGYLLTKDFGPRVRLAAVTTDLPLVPDKPIDIGVEDFCKFCKKCAICCPSNSIPAGHREVTNGSLRWKLNEQTCFDYWGKIGTDCNVCMRVCPWSHGRTFPHRLIVTMITRNALARRVFSIMDDIFYGRKPKPKEGPKWASFKRAIPHHL